MARVEELARPGEKAVMPLRYLLSLSHGGNPVTPQASVRWAEAASLTAHSAVSLGSNMKPTPSYFFGPRLKYRASHGRSTTVEPSVQIFLNPSLAWYRGLQPLYL